MWQDFDPNWRQFVGTVFVLMLEDFASALPASLVSRLEQALRLAVVGEPDGRVAASYTNIALMKAWLDVEVGRRLSEPALLARGERTADEIVALFESTGAFHEYNSPTYYGIDLYALSLWRGRSSSAQLREQGARLEAALWRDVARWYHAGLGNLCGPYSRTYGLDLHAYVGVLSLFLWQAFGREAAPLPPLGPEADHAHDFLLGPLVSGLGVEIPRDASDALTRFPGEHEVRQEISTEPLRVATGWLADRVMMGAESSGSDRFSAWEQFVPATVHWALPDGGVGWLVVRTRAAPRATATAGRLECRWPVSPGELRVTIYAPGATAADFTPTSFVLPGLRLRVETDLADPEISFRDDSVRLVYRRESADRESTFTLLVDRVGP